MPAPKVPPESHAEARETTGVPDPRVVRTGQALRAGLLALLERKPLEQVTIRDITAEAGISYATFFRHHPSKEALLDHLAADQIDLLVAHTLPVFDAVDGRAAFQALCAHVDEHRALWTALLTGGAAGAVRTELLRISREVAKDRDRTSDWLPPELGILCPVSAIVEIITWWLRQEAGAYPVDQVAGLLHRFALGPILEQSRG